ncbi:hypothetical protein ACH5RR_041743 [Cinchona calisaya]|uniref:Uncharacterized protein n=1 Tax=Cinchona calisaya TaxID=153742 RepID=A0ABD2XUF0_9GENT
MPSLPGLGIGILFNFTFIMGTDQTSSRTMNIPQGASNSDEYFLQHSLVFAESLKDLKNLRIQLFSAAEYFESSYKKHDYKQLVVETLKDYASKALISTVDHLGSVAYKVDNLLDEKVNEISATRLQFSCLEQRMRTCRGYIDHNGLLQQSSAIKTPKHYKQYTIPVEESRCPRKFDSQDTKQDDSLAKPYQGAVAKPHPALMRRGHSRPSTTEFSPKPISFSFVRVTSKKEVGKRTTSPFRNLPLKRSGSVANRSTSPNSSASKQRWPSEPRKAVSIFMNPEGNKGKEIQLYCKKSKHLFKVLLGIHRSRKQDVPYRFGDDK